MKLDKTYAAVLLMEILFEQGLINKETLQAAREKIKDTAKRPSAA